MGCAQQVTRTHVDCIKEAQQAFGTRSQAAIKICGTLGEASSQHVAGVNRAPDYRRDCEAPGERVPEQSVHEQQRWARTSAQVAHAGVVDRDPVLIDRLCVS